jgi:hypothetical protein
MVFKMFKKIGLSLVLAAGEKNIISVPPSPKMLGRVARSAGKLLVCWNYVCQG